MKVHSRPTIPRFMQIGRPRSTAKIIAQRVLELPGFSSLSARSGFLLPKFIKETEHQKAKDSSIYSPLVIDCHDVKLLMINSTEITCGT